MSSLQHEIIVFHLVAGNEIEPDYAGYTTLEDLETGATVQVNREQPGHYQQRLQQYLAHLRLQLLDRKIFYRLIRTDQPLDEALRDFLNQRNKSST